MDLSLIGAMATAITSAKQLATSALAIRDFNEMAAVVSQLNEQLLKAQESLFSHNTELLGLQQKQFETAEELRKLKEALAERGRYTLFELSDRVFVYQMNVVPALGEASDPVGKEPLHYLCQPCFDKGIKSVLQKYDFYGSISLECKICKERFSTGIIEQTGNTLTVTR